MQLIIDSANLLHRTYWVSKSQVLTNSKGENTACVFKFLRSLFALANQFTPNEIYAVWDKKEDCGTDHYRTTLTEGSYKAGRDKSEQDLIYINETKLIPVVGYLGIKNLFPKVLEADDIIAWLAEKLKEDELVTIVSCDKDFFQLVKPNIQVYNPFKQQVFHVNNFEKLTGVKTNEYLRYKALVGDVADNLQSAALAGIGPKGAIRIIRGEKPLSDTQKIAVQNLETLMDLRQGLIQHPEDVIFCEEQFIKLQTHEADFKKFKEYCQENNFASILNSFDNWKRTFGKNKLVDLINSLK